MAHATLLAAFKWGIPMTIMRLGPIRRTGAEDLNADRLALSEEMREFQGSFEDNSEIGSEITEFMRKWLVSHILESDKELSGYLQAQAHD